MKYKVQFVNLETGFTIIEIFPNFNFVLDIITELKNEASHKYRITISIELTNKSSDEYLITITSKPITSNPIL